MSAKKWKPLTTGCVGACVKFASHDGWFVADIIRVGTHCVVVAGGPVTPDTLERGRDSDITHQLSEMGPLSGKGYDGAIYWNPRRGIFVVPIVNVTVNPEELP